LIPLPTEILPEIQIFSNKLLLADTTEKLVNGLSGIRGVKKMTLSGPSIPKTVPMGPAKGMENEHTERKRIKVNDEEVVLEVEVGRIFLEIDDVENVKRILSNVEGVCNDLIPCGYVIHIGRYTIPTAFDYAEGVKIREMTA